MRTSTTRVRSIRARLITVSLGLAALLLALDLSAKASINYAADQPGACPPAATHHDDEEDDASAEPPVPSTGVTRSGSAPIKSGKSSRPKWKALLPGAIK